MQREVDSLRAIDLYSGIGGWALGLRLAGISVVASYDIWAAANATNRFNNQHEVHTTNIREIDFSTLPPDIDIVVGSPPCTQFSYSNRGGTGDLEDGLRDIHHFLSIVAFLQPRFWAMENVPRVRDILERELRPGGQLERFRNLNMHFGLYDMQLYGLPQRRKRCIAGNFDEGLLRSYSLTSPRLTLRDVIVALNDGPVTDPIYGFKIAPGNLTDHYTNDLLSEEEVRINHAAKVLHPVYNRMAFPDCLDKPVRTVTATCTRVSRESIVVEVPSQPGSYRRLSVRERTTLQGFPITYQLLGTSFEHKIRMAGNALPPVFAFHVAKTFQGAPTANWSETHVENLLTSQLAYPALSTPGRANPGRYSSARRFKFAIPSLHLGSGVRFELKNSPATTPCTWQINFVFGTSKNIHSFAPTFDPIENALSSANKDQRRKLLQVLQAIECDLNSVEIAKLQDRWSHKTNIGPHPFHVLDLLDAASRHLMEIFSDNGAVSRCCIELAIASEFGSNSVELKGIAKLYRHAAVVAAGLALGGAANRSFAKLISANRCGSSE